MHIITKRLQDIEFIDRSDWLVLGGFVSIDHIKIIDDWKLIIGA